MMTEPSSPRPRTRRRARQGGQALLEFALVAPIIVLLLVAAVDVGRGVFAYNSITNGAREGARLAIVNQDVPRITQRATSQAAITESPNVTVTFKDPDPNANPALNDDCDPLTQLGCVVTVRFRSTYQPITPIIKNILFPNGVELEAVSIETVEFNCPNSTLTPADCPRQP